MWTITSGANRSQLTEFVCTEVITVYVRIKQTKITLQHTNDVLFTERTSAVLDEPSIHTAAVKLMNTRQHTNLLQ